MPPIQYWFTGGALGAFLGLLGALGGVSALGYAWYRAAVTELEAASGKAASALQKLKADRVKDLLGKALASGDKLIQSQKDKDEDQAEKDAQRWVEQTRNLIAAAYGEGAQDAQPGRATFAEMVAFARLASVPCQRLAPDADSFHALALRRLIKPPITEEEIAAKEKDIKRLRVRLGVSSWCKRYAGQMEQARILVQVLRRQN